jgi:hypothetical protein
MNTVPGSVSQRLPAARAGRSTSPGTRSATTVPVARVALPRRAEWRDHFGVWFVLGLLVAVAYAAAAPAPSAVAREQVEHGGLQAGVSALWLVLGRMAIGFPLGDPSAHLRALSIVAGAGLAAIWCWRSATDGRLAAARALTPVEVVGAAAGVLTLALSRSFFQAATTAGPVAAGALAAIAPLVLAERVWRTPTDRRLGLALAAVAGVSAGAPLAAAAIGWPFATLAWARALQRRARWATPAPMVFGLAAIASIVGLARGSAAIGAGDLGRNLFLVPVARAIAGISTTAIAHAVAELADQVGVLALLVAAVGLTRLDATSWLATLWPLVAGVVLRAALGDADGTIGIIVAAAAVALPLGAGTVRLGERLGRAALPAAAAVGVIVVVWPLLAR